MLRHDQFEAWLQLENNTYVSEYMTQVNGNEVSCIVGSTSKIPFSVHWQDKGSKLFTAGYIIVDGVKSAGRFLHGTGQTYRGGFRKGPTSEDPFTFTREHGTIKLVITLVESGKLRVPDDAQAVIANRDQMLASQGLSYRRIPGHETMTVPLQHEATYSVSGASGKPGPTIVTFTFNYRSKEWMEANNISKMRPNTPPLPITVWNSRDYGTQHGEEWPASSLKIQEYEPKQVYSTPEGAEHAWQIKEMYKTEFEAEMMRRYGRPPTNWDDPEAVKNIPNDSIHRKVRKSRKGKEPETRTERSGKTRVSQKGAASSHDAGEQQSTQPQTESKTKESGRAPFDGVARIGELKEMYKEEFEAEMARRYGPDWNKPKPPMRYKPRKSTTNLRSSPSKQKQKAPVEPEMARRDETTLQSKVASRPADMQQHPRASNTYVLPSPAPSSSSSTPTPRLAFDAGRSSSRTMQPPPVPYLTPSGRPSAIIDTRFFGYASPAPSEASTSSAHRSAQPAQR
ncbi:hypothetical protein ACEPAH_4331 [Sanghuangporus vaninii]